MIVLCSKYEYYIHYEGFNRRLDEWVTRDRIKALEEENGEVKGPFKYLSTLILLANNALYFQRH